MSETITLQKVELSPVDSPVLFKFTFKVSDGTKEVCHDSFVDMDSNSEKTPREIAEIAYKQIEGRVKLSLRVINQLKLLEGREIVISR